MYAEIASKASPPTLRLRYSGSTNIYIIAAIVAARGGGLMLYISRIVVSISSHEGPLRVVIPKRAIFFFRSVPGSEWSYIEASTSELSCQ